MRCVLDASVTLAWSMPDEEHELAERLFADPDSQFVVPAHWPFEVANGLASRRRRNLLDDEAVAAVARILSDLPVTVLPLETSELLGPVIGRGIEHYLSVYDAAYLHLALREGVPLATLDTRLRAAATAAGCTLFS